MKKILLVAAIIGMGVSLVNAQSATPTPASTPAAKQTMPVEPKKEGIKKEEMKAKHAVNEAKEEKSKAKVADASVKGGMKADGTPDRRFKGNKNLKKDGTPDKRFKGNQKKEEAPKATPTDKK
jgi:hypothetical protein